MESRKFFAVIMGAVALLAQAVSAAPIVAINYDTIIATQGTQVSGPSVDTFINLGTPSDVGTLTNTVFFNDNTGVYTYVHLVNPTNSQDFSEFNTGFAPLGFNGVAGYSFSQAASIGVSFNVVVGDDGTIDWETTTEADWDAGESVTFFFQSDRAPTTGGRYNIIDGVVGSAFSFQPIPAPAALYGGMMLMGMVIATTRRRRR